MHVYEHALSNALAAQVLEQGKRQQQLPMLECIAF